MKSAWREVPYDRIGRWVLWVAFFVAIWQYAKVIGMDVSEGVVIGHDQQDGFEGGLFYAPIISYPDGSGFWPNYSPRYATGWKVFKEGEKKRIYFAPKDFERRGVLSFGYVFGFSWEMALLGVGFAVFGWGIGKGYYPGRLLLLIVVGAAVFTSLNILHWSDRSMWRHGLR